MHVTVSIASCRVLRCFGWLRSSLCNCCGFGLLGFFQLRFAGMEASEYIQRGGAADVMLLDIRMPLRSGVEVVEGCAGSPPPYPIVAMTGHVDIEARDQFRWVRLA